MKAKIYPISLIFFVCSANAEVVTDGSIGIQANILASNNEYKITETLGTKSGDNLFHSFSEFSVEQGNTAIFSGSSNITNIIARVSGNGASVIDGGVSTSIDGANFWLLNPNGVIVGNGATFDISGNLQLSTANYLKFADGNKYDTNIALDSGVLSISSPESFGFLSSNSSTVIFDNASLTNTSGDLFVVSRSVTFSDSVIAMENGDFTVVATNTMDTVNLNDITTMEFSSDDYGDINLVNSEITTSSNLTNIAIKSNKVEIVNSQITNTSTNIQNSSSIFIEANFIASKDSSILSDSIDKLLMDNNNDAINLQVDAYSRISDISATIPDDTILLEVKTEPALIKNDIAVDSDVGNDQIETNDTQYFHQTEFQEAKVDGNKKFVNLSENPCNKVNDGSTFAVKDNNLVLSSPESFNPGLRYKQLDTMNTSHMSNSFHGCST